MDIEIAFKNVKVSTTIVENRCNNVIVKLLTVSSIITDRFFHYY
jgi:hypothetical protein